MVSIAINRIVLREFKESDWMDVHEYACDPEVSRYMEWGPNTEDETRTFIQRALGWQKEDPRRFYELAVTNADDGAVIGAAGIRMTEAPFDQADVGYCYHKKVWGQGTATEVCKALLKFGFEELDLHRIVAKCDADNVGSARVLQKSGMRQEAHFVKDLYAKGAWRDTLLFAILQEEWQRAR